MSSRIDARGLQSARVMRRTDCNEASHVGGNYTFGWRPDKGKEAASALHFHISLAAIDASSR